ncbi:hypothetical protein LXM94_16995 [Rhizobium sp. TRM95111]|uniref:hypothetical protein n=1 Tax=Rhizobium alarense TaxID=2846851 RepID=UPI001F17A255|nr:hypothetical protein [Rhizobium alarense]MCF3641671.1 hypothetical protein [Rhizobium alarense]
MQIALDGLFPGFAVAGEGGVVRIAGCKRKAVFTAGRDPAHPRAPRDPILCGLPPHGAELPMN